MDEDFSYIRSFHSATVSPPVAKPRRTLRSSSSSHSARPKHASGTCRGKTSTASSSFRKQPHHRIRSAPPIGRGGRPLTHASGIRVIPSLLPSFPPYCRTNSTPQTVPSNSSTRGRQKVRNVAQMRPQGGNSVSSQKPRSVAVKNFTSTGATPQPKPNNQRSSSHQRFYRQDGGNVPRNDPQSGIGYKSVEQMVSDDSLDCKKIALRLTTENSGFALRLKASNLHHGWIQLILKLFAKLSKNDNPDHYFMRLLVTLINNDFHIRIIEFLTDALKIEQRFNKDNASVHVTNTLLLLRSWLQYAPNSSQLAVEILLPFLKIRVKSTGLAELGNIAELLVETEELLQHCNKKEQQRHDPASPLKLHEEEPPDDFRSLSVFPTRNDIYDHNPFVRINLTTSAYRSADHYLDVQFRLLREDFVRPLRQGIAEFLNSNYQPGKKKQRLEGIKIYQNVNVEFPKLSPKGITYCLRFDVEKLKHVQWQNSKRLLYGNLVCLSADGFTDNFLFASITDRTVESLRDGYIEVEFWNIEGTEVGMDNVEEIQGGRSFATF